MNEQFNSIFGKVELTQERKKHIFEFHPEVRSYRKYFPETLTKPDVIRRSKSDQAVLILYKLLQKKYLAIVIKTNKRNFVLTAYLTDKIQHQSL